MLSEDAIKYFQAAGGTANFLSVAHHLHYGLSFLIESGVLEHAELDDGGLTSGQLAAAAQVQQGALVALLEVMVHFDVLQRRADRFVLGDEGRLLRRRAQDQAYYAMRLSACVPQAALELAKVMRTGRSGVELAYGERFYERASHAEAMGQAVAGLCESFFVSCDLVYTSVDRIARGGHRTIVDLGGGHGRFLCSVLEKAPASQGILFDLPGMLDRYREQLTGIPRLTLCAGDFFDKVPRADAYILANVIANWGESAVTQLLDVIYGASEPCATLYILDFFLDGSFASALLNLDELIATGGACHRRELIAALVKRSGFTLKDCIHGDSSFRLLVCDVEK